MVEEGKKKKEMCVLLGADVKGPCIALYMKLWWRRKKSTKK